MQKGDREGRWRSRGGEGKLMRSSVGVEVEKGRSDGGALVEKELVGIATSQGAEKEEGTERRWKKSNRKGAAMERSGDGKERRWQGAAMRRRD